MKAKIMVWVHELAIKMKHTPKTWTRGKGVPITQVSLIRFQQEALKIIQFWPQKKIRKREIFKDLKFSPNQCEAPVPERSKGVDSRSHQPCKEFKPCWSQNILLNDSSRGFKSHPVHSFLQRFSAFLFGVWAKALFRSYFHLAFVHLIFLIWKFQWRLALWQEDLVHLVRSWSQ